MIIPYRDKLPEAGEDVFIAPGAVVIGDVTIGSGSGVWFGAVIRGDVNHIRIGSRTNIQDGCVLHVSLSTFSLEIGDDVTIGHNATVHGCRIQDRALIGMGATVLDGAVIESDSVVAAGAVVKEGFTVPSGTLVAGVPAKVIRDLTDDEKRGIMLSAEHYSEIAKEYLATVTQQEG